MDFANFHDPIRWQGNVANGWGKCVRVRNVSAHTLVVGHGVIVAGTTQAGLDDRVGVMATSTSSTLTRSKVLGLVYGEDIEPYDVGTVLYFGPHMTVWVTGTVYHGDWLWLAQARRRGLLSKKLTDQNIAFVIAGEDHTGSASTIKGLVVPWRT